ncbi:MAG: type II secretion system F family protein [bacterium]|nr:type II secretion system F family protein [bacterium]
MAQQAEILDTAVGRHVLDSLKLRLAAEIGPLRWRRPLQNLAALLGQGIPLDDALRQQSGALPAELNSLLRESLKVRDPAGLLIEAIRVRTKSDKGWRILVSTSVYPMVLFVAALAVGLAFSFSIRSMVTLDWFDEFGLMGFENLRASIDDQHHAILGMAMITAWVLMVLLSLWFVGPPWAWLAVMGGMILVGKPLRWMSLQEMLNRYHLFLVHGLQPAAAVDAAARSFHSSRQSVFSQSIARDVQLGMPLGRAIGACSLTDGLCRPIVLLIDQRSEDLDLALSDAANVLGQMAEQRCRSLATVVPVFALALVGTILFGAIASYLMSLMPLVTMISSLA